MKWKMSLAYSHARNAAILQDWVQFETSRFGIGSKAFAINDYASTPY